MIRIGTAIADSAVTLGVAPDDWLCRLAGVMTHPGRHPYQEIADALLADIQAGRYGQKDLLPSENELADRYGVTTLTARNALKALVNAGIIRSERAKGYYVRFYDRQIVNTSLTGGGREVGAQVEVRIMEPPAYVAELLPGVTEVVRRRAIGGAVKDSFYPRELTSLVPALGGSAPIVEPPDHILLAEAGIVIAEQDADVVGRMPTSEEAALLGLGAGTPVLEQTTALVDEDGQVRAVRVSLYAGDRYKLRFKLRG
ncbi:GntR family transcriptional regulator [Streptosporangium roseum]|uniref:GntR family transcriptional regulator n=1 Tax=Streptosporangium roseum TaxID=2001 RepID=UPI00332B3B64